MEIYLTILFRTLLLYVLILLIFRLMGKREIGELSLLDLVVFIMIAELAVVAIESTETPIIESVFPMVILMLTQLSLALVSLKSKKFRDLLDGEPIIIINKGKIDENAMRKQRYNFDDLLLQLREKDVRNISDVEFAILEPSGKLSVFERENDTQGQGGKSGEITLPLIIDGCLQEDNIKLIGKSTFWLRKELKNRGFQNLKEISFCSFQNDEFYIDIIDDKK